MIKLKWSEKSLTNMMANCQKLKLNSKQGAKRALKEVAVNIMAQSMSECPIDTATLVSTSYIEQPVDSGDKVSIKMGYASPVTDKLNPVPDKFTGLNKMASEYALIVHETPATPPGGGNYHPYGKWKFLEDPVRAHAQAFIQTLARELRVVFAPGVKVR